MCTGGRNAVYCDMLSSIRNNRVCIIGRLYCRYLRILILSVNHGDVFVLCTDCTVYLGAIEFTFVDLLIQCRIKMSAAVHSKAIADARSVNI